MTRILAKSNPVALGACELRQLKERFQPATSWYVSKPMSRSRIKDLLRLCALSYSWFCSNATVTEILLQAFDLPGSEQSYGSDLQLPDCLVAWRCQAFHLAFRLVAEDNKQGSAVV